MELTDRIDWVAYEAMLRKALSEGMDGEQAGLVNTDERRDELRNIKEELDMLASGNRQGIIEKYHGELGEDTDEYFKGFLKD